MKRLILGNFWWKLFSLAFAVGLWFTLVGEAERGTSATADLQFKNLPADLEISSDPIDRIFLKIKGPASRLADPQLTQASVVLDLASVNKPGEQTFTLDETDVQLPPGVTLERVIPSQIRLRFERRISRDVPITVRFSGSPPQGYSMNGVETSPNTVRITGPESHVDHTKAAETDAIDVTTTVADASFRVSVFVADPQVRVVGSPVVSVRVKLEKAPGVQSQGPEH
jgi:hypothetical protein